MKIDAHNHADWHGHNLERALADMDACGIEKAWLLSRVAPEDEYAPQNAAVYNVDHANGDGPLAFARALSWAERRPERFILGYAPDPRRPDALDRLKTAVDLYGVRVYGELKLRMMYDDWDAVRLYRWCGEHGLPVTVHIDYAFPTGRTYPRPDYWYGGGIEAFGRAVAACPETVFIGHAPGFWAHISGDGQHDKTPYPKGAVVPGGRVAQLLERYPNLRCDLSAGSARNALARDPDHAKAFLTAWQDRLLYGRDCFDNLLAEFLDGLGLPRTVLDKIYQRNAQRLLDRSP